LWSRSKRTNSAIEHGQFARFWRAQTAGTRDILVVVVLLLLLLLVAVAVVVVVGAGRLLKIVGVG